MPDLAPTVDGTIGRFQQSTWADAREGTTGGILASSSTRLSNAIQATRGSSRGGGTVYHVYRAFFEFDTSGISATPQDATLKLYGFGTNVADFFVVKADTATDGALALGDFDAITGWNNSADNSSNVTKYSSEITSFTTVSYNNITLNSTALTDMTNNNVIKFCLIESTRDLTNTEPTSTISTGLYFQEYTGTSFDPILNYTAAGGSGYSNNVMGVSSGDIDNVIGVATANIDNVIGS